MKRSPVRKVSKKRAAGTDERVAIRLEVFERDNFECQARGWRGDCSFHLTPHHVKKASRGGSYTLDNLLTLCVRHNDLIETYPNDARQRGWVK